MKKIIVLGTLLSSFISFGQLNPHFSLWQAAPSYLNPAATAASGDDFSFFASSRAQWLTALPAPLLTSSFCGEAKLFKDELASGWFGSGIHFYNDEVGKTKVSTLSVSVPINYVMELSDNTLFSLGMKPGVIQRSIDAAFQTWDNQWNGIAFDQTVISGEQSNRKFTTFDFGAGMYMQHLTRNDSKINFGFAMNHINRPDVTFRTITEQLNTQYIGHFGAQFNLEQYRFKISPQVTTFYQGPVKYLTLGSSIDVVLKEGSRRTIFVKDQTLGFGLFYRTGDALIISSTLKLENFTVGLAYDAPLSTIRTATGYVGAFELFLKYSFDYGQKKKFLR